MTNTSLDPNAGGGRSTRGRVPFFSPRLNGTDLDISVTDWTMTCTEGAHDEGTINCVSTTLEDTDGILDSAVSFYYGQPPRTELFQGYVTNVTDAQTAQGQLSFSMTVLGATKVMFSGKPRYWVNKSAASAATDLIFTNGLGAGGHTSDYKWKSLAQTCESDWEMIKDLANRLGWVVFARYGVVLLYDPIRLFKGSGAYTKLVADLTDVGANDRTMIEFSSQEISSMIKDNLGTRCGYFTTNSDVQVAQQKGDFKGYLFDSSKLVRDQAEAAQFVSASDIRTDSWGEAAMARIWGDADLWPGMCVDVVTTSQRFISPKGDGRWMIRSVGQQADRSNYQTILLLTRPSADVIGATRTYESTLYRPFWEADFDPSKARPFMTLGEDKTWVSSWSDQRLRGLL